MPGHAAPVTARNIHRTTPSNIDERSKASTSTTHHNHPHLHPPESNSLHDVGNDDDVDPCEGDVCIAEYPDPVHHHRTSNSANSGDGNSDGNGDVDDGTSIVLDNVTYSGMISEGTCRILRKYN